MSPKKPVTEKSSALAKKNAANGAENIDGAALFGRAAAIIEKRLLRTARQLSGTLIYPDKIIVNKKSLKFKIAQYSYLNRLSYFFLARSFIEVLKRYTIFTLPKRNSSFEAI
jgi:hypothetical protein